MKRNFYIFLFIIGIIDSALTPVSAQWEGWTYRRTIAVSNPSGTPLTDYQVRITLDNTFNFENAEPDGSDLRFAAADEVTQIPFWIEEWNAAGAQASIWVKVPSIPTTGTNIYLYYGNSSPIIPTLDPVETPPIGPFTRALGNPIVPSGATGTSLLAENIVFDPVTGHYWMCLANYSQAAISLCYSNNPTDPSSWIWSGNVITTFSIFYSGAPHLILEGGTWYLFYADRPNILVATASNVAGPYTINPTPVLSPSGPTPAWDAFRVDEPFVFKRNDGKWILIYMADAGNVTEQVGYATADNITGPYTAYSGNPVIRFGDPGTFDAGTVADPWVYEYHGVYYIGYTVSSTKISPWQTALATTSDWINFTKHGVILPASGTSFDNANSFRGALTRIGDTYVFSYTGGGYGMGIATQPVYMSPPDIINNRDAVFDFYDEFDGSTLNTAKWTINPTVSSTQATVSGGLLTLYSPNMAGYIRILGNTSFGMNYIMETRASHPDQGTQDMIAEVGFTSPDWNTVRIVDDFMLGTTYWQRQAKIAPNDDNQHPFVNMTQTADPNWHMFRVFRQGTNTAGYQIDDNAIETTTTNVPTMNLPPFLMSFGIENDFIVDWTRVRKFASSEPVPSVGPEGANPLPVELSSFSASVIGSTVKLNWRTETEVNNYGFDVERQVHTSTPLSMTGWEKIGFVNGNGNSNSPKNYSYEDKALTEGKYLYRLKQIDSDGQFEYSKTIEVDFGAPKKFELSQNYPNPFNPKTTIRFSLPESGNVRLTLFNTIGQEVKTIVNEYKESGTHTVNFDGSELNSGMYLYKLESGSFVLTRKMILLK